MLKIIIFLKKFIDKLYYIKYNAWNKEILIRQMFPWIEKVWEYSKIEDFLQGRSTSEIDQVVSTIMSYYWWEVARLNSNKNHDEIWSLQWLVDFCQSLKDYLNELYILNNNK